MLLKFLPQEFNFFNLFEKQADYAVEASKVFKEIAVSNTIVTEATYQRIQRIEHEADDAAHTVMEQLNKTFITPFDREDIHALTKELDNILDMFNTIVNRLKVYKLAGGNKELMEFASIIELSVIMVAKAVKGLRDHKQVKTILDACVEVNRLENVGDNMRDHVLANLFETTKDAIYIIKWKEIYEDAETMLDICEDVVHVIESILVKQA